MLLGSAAQAAEPEDPFRYLEDRNDPRTLEFLKTQAGATAEVLAKLPGRAKMQERVKALSEGSVVVRELRLAGKRLFYLRQPAGSGQPVLCFREGTSGTERVVVDPATFDQGETRAAIDWYAPSPDGKHVAYGISRGGDEASVLRVTVVDGARDTGLAIDRTRFNHHLAWHPDGRSFYYARLPAAGQGVRPGANVRVYRHVLGRDAGKDEVVFASGVGGAREVPVYARPFLHIPEESRFAYAVVRDGMRNEVAVHSTELRDLAEGRPRWRRLAGYEDEVLAIEAWKGDLYVLSKKNAPNHRVLRVAADARSLAGARVIVPEGDIVLRSMGLARDALYLRTMEGGTDRLERVPVGLLGRLRKPEFLRTPFDNAIAELVTHPEQPGALLRLQGWIDAPRIVQVEPRSGDLRDTRLQPPSPADFSQMDEVRLYAPAADGTRIPVTLMYDKSTRLTGENPTLLTVFGAYGQIQSAVFEPARLAWLERGGVYAVAHVRGGGEYGERWHQAGRGEAKSTTVSDFIAVAEFLTRYGFTNPRRLAVGGRGAGAIAVGGALARRPELFSVALLQAPIADLLRLDRAGDGPVMLPEFGSSATPAAAERLRAVSAFHLLQEGGAYPATLITAGYNDRRVDPAQPARFAARLQAATGSARPVLLRVDFNSGHGPGTARTRLAQELADLYSFALWQFGDPAFAMPGASHVPAPPPPPDEDAAPAPLSAR